jgi:hypothetical protein
MTTRIEVNCQTGKVKEIELTQAELDAAATAKAAEDEFNSPDNVAERDIKNSFEADKVRRLIFEIEFNQENRIRVLEGKLPISRPTYRDTLIALYKSLP